METMFKKSATPFLEFDPVSLVGKWYSKDKGLMIDKVRPCPCGGHVYAKIHLVEEKVSAQCTNCERHHETKLYATLDCHGNQSLKGFMWDLKGATDEVLFDWNRGIEKMIENDLVEDVGYEKFDEHDFWAIYDDDKR